jgi:hypothetical protein
LSIQNIVLNNLNITSTNSNFTKTIINDLNNKSILKSGLKKKLNPNINNKLVTLAQQCINNIDMSSVKIIDGVSYPAFAKEEEVFFKRNLETYYQKREEYINSTKLKLQEIAVTGSYGYDMLYALLSDSILVSQYLFTQVIDYSIFSNIENFDGVIICEVDYNIDNMEAQSLNSYYNLGKPVILGMDDLDNNFSMYPGTDLLLKPIFGISDAFDGDYNWGSLNSNNPITEGISQIYGGHLGNDNDWYILDGADWIFAGIDGYYYGVSYESNTRSVLMGELLVGIWWDGNDQLISNAINWMMESATWLSVIPDTGTVPAGSSLDISVTFDAAGMYGGDYAANIIINNNDPLNPQLTVPANLHVTGVQDISVSKDTLDYGSLFIGATAYDSIIVTNTGTDFSLQPQESQLVTVSFSPSTNAIISGQMSIMSDDPDEPTVTVELTGEGLIPPVIAVTPDSLFA